jgi:hypothetical protein
MSIPTIPAVATVAMCGLDMIRPLRLFGYGSDHHFDHHLGLSTEIHLSAKPLFLRNIGRLRTFVDALPMSGGQGLASSSLAGPSNRSTPSDI